MTIALTKITSQGQTSVPAEVRRKLGIGPGSVLEWSVEGGEIRIQRSARYSSADVHRALFPQKDPTPRSIEEMKEGVRRFVRKRHARR